MIWLNARTATVLLMGGIFATMLVIAAGYPPNARLMPMVIGVPGLIFCLIQLAIEIRETAGHDDEQRAKDAITLREVRFFLWLPAFIICVLLFGFLVSAVVMVFAFLRLSEKEPLKTAAVFAVGGAVVLYVVFEIVLGLEMFRGFIWPLLVE